MVRSGGAGGVIYPFARAASLIDYCDGGMVGRPICARCGDPIAEAVVGDGYQCVMRFGADEVVGAVTLHCPCADADEMATAVAEAG